MSKDFWSPSRRDFLKVVGASSVVVSTPTQAKITPPIPLNEYQPVFFQGRRMAFYSSSLRSSYSL